MRKKAMLKGELKYKSVDEINQLIMDDELQLFKWNNPVERGIGAFATKGKGHPYKMIKRRIAFMKKVVGDRESGRVTKNY